MKSGPIRLASPSDLAVQVNANGSLRRIDHRDVIVNAYLGSEVEGGPANLYLRRRGARIEWTPLLGPRSPGAVRLDAQGFEIAGTWSGIRFRVSLTLAAAAPAWFWHVTLANDGPAAELDLVFAQDLALADYGAVRLNEYYVSHYVDHTPLVHARCGTVVASRQNLSVGGRHPWLVLGSLDRSASFATDALQLHGLATRAGDAPIGLAADRLPGTRLQHEHALVAIQDEALRLATGASATRGFFAWFEPDHADATSDADLALVDRALALPEASAPAARATAPGAPRSATLFSDAPILAVRDLAAAELDGHFGRERRCAEADATGRLLSFFTPGGAHVVLPEKERASLRPHGQILRTGAALVPDEASLTTTVWMGGVFHSMLTQGHVSIGRLLSTTHSYLGLFRSDGQRLFVDTGQGWRLLGMPSAFEMTPNGARWLYAHAAALIEVQSWASLDRHETWLSARVLDGAPCRFLVSLHLAVNGDDGAAGPPAHWSRDADGIAIGLLPDTDLGRRFPDGGFRIDWTPETRIEATGGDELLFADGRSREQPFLVLVAAPERALDLRITGQLVAPRSAEPVVPRAAADAVIATRFWREMTGPTDVAAPARAEADRVGAILPWFAHDAWIHHLAPRGLEQYSGGGWGTRDVCQGPVELLLAIGRTAPVRDLLLRVFRNQNADGDWPQWFMFFERERGIRPGDSHGDIVFWPLLALAQYLLASGDAALLREELPYFHPEGDEHAERATLLAHVERALALIEQRVIPGTRLAAYGHGDWNDSMQPADRAQADRLCSAWTVTLHHQTLATLAEALAASGEPALATKLTAQLAPIRDDFQRVLVVDGVVAGLAYFPEAGGVEPWLHPSDRDTGVCYSLLPMIHAILANLFTPEQAAAHVAVIREHLMGADGARLFDRPLPYRGGVQRHFQRAETSTFFGREIGLMYTHAHLRWAEALAHLGDAEAFYAALRQAIPVDLRDAVPNARLRQSNCYTSSSDAAFADRAEASARYDDVRTGAVAVEGGWRVYSSGAGIAVRLIRERLLGVRLRHDAVGIDPVLPRILDGLSATLPLDGRSVRLRYRVGARGCGPTALVLNGAPLPFTRDVNPYRAGGAVVALGDLRERLRGDDELHVEIG